MSLNYPVPPSGTSPEASFHKRMVKCLKGSFPIAGNGLLARETPNGVILSLAGPEAPAGGNNSAVYMFAVTQLLGKDYFMAKYWNGRSLGKEIAIAKPPRMRMSITHEFYDDVRINYAYRTIDPYDPTGDNDRIADDGTDSEFQVLFPRYLTLGYLGLEQPDANSNCGAVIFAAQSVNGTGVTTVAGVKVEWIEVLPARVWARRYLQQ